MKKIRSAYTVAITLITALTVSIQLVAQQQPQEKALPHYRVVDLGPAADWVGGVNNKGAVDGTATLPPDGNRNAFLWRKEAKIILGTFGGPNSVAFKGPTEKGWVVGKAETSHPDPFGEDFCGFDTKLICLPFVWQNGEKTPLPTLGGNNAIAFGVNNRGQVVGAAENTTQDPTCPNPTLEAKPVIWEKGEVRELPTFSNDPDGGVLSTNDDSQAVGASFDCSVSVSHALLWHHGTVTDLGNLGGVTSNFAQNINNRGQVVGFSDLPGDAAFHAFVWTEDRGIQDLGTLPGDVSSGGDGNDDQGRVVGFSCNADFDICRGVLWQGGTITDLNTLIPADSPLFLVEAFSINSRGEITGFAIDQATDEGHAFLAVPENSETRSPASGTAMGAGQRNNVLPESVRKMFQRRAGLGGFSRTQQQVRLVDTAVISVPNVTLSPTSLISSTQVLDTTSAAMRVTLKNTGTASLTIVNIALTGANAGDFAQTHTCGSSLAAGASCSISVTFKPTASGTRTAALSITDNAAGSPQKVALSGIGTTAKVSPVKLTFSTQLIGTTSGAKKVTLTNVGTTSLSINSIAIGGTNSADFGQTHNCGSSLAAGANCSIGVMFTPTISGTSVATLIISDNAAGSPQKVSLSGTGTVVKLNPTSLSFGCFFECHLILGCHCYCSTSGTSTLTNVGSTPLDITDISVSNPWLFSLGNACPRSVGSGQSCTLTVNWRIEAGGVGGIFVNDNGGGSPQTVSLAAAYPRCKP